jgi:hypothetical protein
MIFVLFYFLPFLITIVLPAFVIPLVAMRINKSYDDKILPSLLPFSISLILLAILGNLFWEFFLYNKIYYEWDRLFLPYTFISYESPILDSSASWIASGWNLLYLYILWLGVTSCIYVLSALISLFLIRNNQNFKPNLKIILYSIILLMFMSLSIGTLLQIRFKI